MNECLLRFNLKKCSENDISILRTLLIDNGYKVENSLKINCGEMGVDLASLAVYIPVATAAITGLVAVLQVWLKNRKVEFSIENKKTGKSFQYKSDTGRPLSDDQLIKILEIIDKKP